MKKKQIIMGIIILLTIAIVGAIFYKFLAPEDRCTSRDREILNCAPAGKCGPTPELDAVLDCDVKNYDRKFNTEL